MQERPTQGNTFHQRRTAALDRVSTQGRKVDGAVSDRTLKVLQNQGRVDDNNRIPPSRPEATRSHGERRGRSSKKGFLGRVAVATAITAGGLAAVVHESDTTGAETPAVEVVAGKGDSIWTLMRAEATSHGIDEDADIRGWVDQAVEMNGGTEIDKGQVVKLPVIDPPQTQAAP